MEVIKEGIKTTFKCGKKNEAKAAEKEKAEKKKEVKNVPEK